jgi:hypothetical protein
MRRSGFVAIIGIFFCASVALAENPLAARLTALEQELADLRAQLGPQHVWVDQTGVPFARHPGPLVARPFTNSQPHKPPVGTKDGVLIPRVGAAPILFRNPQEVMRTQPLYYYGADCTGTAYVRGGADVIDAVEVVFGYAAGGRWRTQSGPAELFELFDVQEAATVNRRIDPADGRCVEVALQTLEPASRARPFDQAPIFEGPIEALTEEWR